MIGIDLGPQVSTTHFNKNTIFVRKKEQNTKRHKNKGHLPDIDTSSIHIGKSRVIRDTLHKIQMFRTKSDSFHESLKTMSHETLQNGISNPIISANPWDGFTVSHLQRVRGHF